RFSRDWSSDVCSSDLKTYVNYLDEREIKTKDFYDQVMNGALPTTSQVNPTDYEDTLKPILDAGNDVLILSFSSALSGTYNSGRRSEERRVGKECRTRS